MISIFNGRRRDLGKGANKEIYIQVSVNFRSYLHLLKGAKLSVFLCLALHSDRNGYSFPRVSKICKETGYSRETVFQALKELESIGFDGHPLLVRRQKRATGGEWGSNDYLLFPSSDERERAISPSTGNSNAVEGSPSTGLTESVKDGVGKTRTHKENHDTNYNHDLNDKHVVKSDYVLNRNHVGIERECAGASPPAPTPSKEEQKQSLSKKKTDPLLEHPAVLAFREVHHCWPDSGKPRERLAAIEDIEKLRTVMETWRMRGYRPNNVEGQLDWYKNGIPERNGNGNGQHQGYRGANTTKARPSASEAILAAQEFRTTTRRIGTKRPGEA